MKESELKLAEHLKNVANSLEQGYMDSSAVFGGMIITLTSAGYLKKVKEVYELNVA
jgi:hypothetical protein